MKKRKSMLIFSCVFCILCIFIGEKNTAFAMNAGLKLKYNFTNSRGGNAAGTIELRSTNSSSDGEYKIYWANDSGKLSDFSRITTITVKENETKTFKVGALNAIPKEANKIVAISNGAIEAECIINASKLIMDNKKFSFGALSDIHIDGDGDDSANSINDFENELQYFKSQNVALVGNSGDITRDGRTEDLAEVVKKIQRFGLPFYTARGNHDTLSTCGSMDEWKKIESNGIIFDKVVNNEVFIFMGLNKADYTNPFSNEQISKLKSLLNKYKDKRIFMFEHVFVGSVGNVNGLYPYSSLSDSGTAGEFKRIIKDNKNVILFTGHSHLDFDLSRINEYANVQDESGEYGYRVHCPSASRPRKNDEGNDSSNTYDYKKGALGYLVEVYNDFILLKGRDFEQNKNLPYATYILYTKYNSITPNSNDSVVSTPREETSSQTISNNQSQENANTAICEEASVTDAPQETYVENNSLKGNLDDSPKTSDNTVLAVVMILACVSCLIIIKCMLSCRKRI